MLVLSVCALLVAAISAPASAKRCCFPLQWEGLSTMYVPAVDVYVRSTVSNDLKHKRLASNAIIAHKKHTFHVKAIVNYATRKSYYIYKLGNRRVCRVHSIKNALPANPNCLPASFRSLGTYRIGAGQNSLKLEAYGLFNKYYQNVISVTTDCIPVRDSVFFKHGKHKRKMYGGASWSNITPGIKSSSVFSVPNECYRSQKYNVLQHVAGLNAANKLHDNALDSVFAHIKEFEKEHATKIVKALRTAPHSAVHVEHAAMSNIVQETIKNLKQFSRSAKRSNVWKSLFNKL